MATQNLHKRIKHRQMPGDISKGHKIELREKGETSVSYGPGMVNHIGKTASKNFREVIKSRERAVNKRRVQKDIDAGIL